MIERIVTRGVSYISANRNISGYGGGKYKKNKAIDYEFLLAGISCRFDCYNNVSYGTTGFRYIIRYGE